LSNETEHLERWARYRNSALLFATEVFGFKLPGEEAGPDEIVLEQWQVDALNAISTSDRVSIRAGHGVGKTFYLALVVFWFMLTRYPYKIPITANSQDQLRDIIWPELRKMRRRLPPELQSVIRVTAERVLLGEIEEGDDEAPFAVARTASKDNPEALQGFHEENLLFVIEEASGIEDIVFEVAQGALSTPGAKVVMCANPTRTDGFFYDTHHKLRHRWKTLHVSSLDVPRARGHVEDIVAKYGLDSNAYRVRVLGEFPKTGDDTVISLELCEAARARDVKPNESFRVVWGVDVARFGSDRTALAKRRGNVQVEPLKSWRNKDTMQVAGLIKAEWDQCWPHDDRPSEILVDVIGIGAGVVDRCRELGLPVRGINVGESPAVGDRYMRLRDELWFRAREWLDARDSRLADDDALISELVGVKYKFASSGKIQVESKDEMKKRGLDSPDLADAWCLTFAGGLDRKEEHTHDRYRRKPRHSGSWMSA
jgi:phage terminase large subunit